jgi:adenylate cyclase
VGTMPGVEIQAALLQTLLAGSILRRPLRVVQVENVALLVLGLALAWAGPFLRASLLPPLLAVVVAAGLGVTWYAFWNASLAVELHARTACLAALGMRARLRELNEALLAEAEEGGTPFQELRIGIGLNTGVCFVGNMGSEQRFNYSVVGDPVNVAARLEVSCKTYAVDIVIGETTWKAAADLAALELDRVRLLGKTTASRIFALVGDQDCARSERFRELAAEHAALLDAYGGRDWDGAAAKLPRCQHLGRAYGLAAFYAGYAERIDRCRADDLLPAGWDGPAVAEIKR